MEKIIKLKEFFKSEKIDGYFIPKNDEFFGEYVSKYNDRLNYVTKFTGSYGFSLILKSKNYLFVDGRYTLQAINQCGKLFKVITIPEKMPKDILKGNITIGFDPKLFTKKTLEVFFNKKNFKLKPVKKNLIDKVWKRKNKLNRAKFYTLPNNSVSNNFSTKIKIIVSKLKKRKADFQFITSSENNAWLLNIRGRDSNYTPIPHSYILIDKHKNILFFCDLKKISKSFKKKFKTIKFLDIDYVDEILIKIRGKKFLIDNSTCSFYYEEIINKNNKILNYNDPIYYLKSIKSNQEIKNIKKAHIFDGVALTKYLLWIKKNFNKKRITEIDASNKLYEFRKKSNTFKFSSFPTISGTGPNGAIIHYRATKKTNRTLKQGEVYLVDSGGQYEFGTTDVTRTISLGNKNERVKNIYTRVLKGHIAVANFKLKKNTSGANIDIVARKYLKQIGLDYSHGTGHGVGYFLNVHEGPQAISKNNKIYFKDGMIVSNEPGFYERNKFGIRIENLIYVKKEKTRRYFENLTMVPIDKDLIDKSILNEDEKIWINKYHKKVFSNLKNFMNKIEIDELRQACSAI